jgi:hypothetical protein
MLLKAPRNKKKQLKLEIHFFDVAEKLCVRIYDLFFAMA